MKGIREQMDEDRSEMNIYIVDHEGKSKGEKFESLDGKRREKIYECEMWQEPGCRRHYRMRKAERNGRYYDSGCSCVTCFLYRRTNGWSECG